jgi:DNA-binding NtrC family response regulator
VPPLREHPEDIPELAAFFLAKVSGECRRNFKLTAAAMRKLQAHQWAGNVRQLRAAIESAAVMSEGETIDAEAIPLTGATDLVAAQPAAAQLADAPPSLDMDDVETWAICRAMRQTGGNVSHAAKLLGISRDTLHNKLKFLKEKKGIDRSSLTNTPAPVGAPEPVTTAEA